LTFKTKARLESREIDSGQKLKKFKLKNKNLKIQLKKLTIKNFKARVIFPRFFLDLYIRFSIPFDITSEISTNNPFFSHTDTLRRSFTFPSSPTLSLSFGHSSFDAFYEFRNKTFFLLLQHWIAFQNKRQ
jgi:hypothetical protein